MFAFNRKPTPAVAHATALKPVSPHAAGTQPVNPLWVRLALSTGAGTVPATIHRKCAQAGDGESKSAQAQRASSTNPEAAPDTRDALRTAERDGTLMPGGVRTYFESYFGHDFSSIRVHHDGAAAESARAMNARAYTVGQDIVFGAGQYEPFTLRGRRLLAHELAHAIQQSRGGAEPPSLLPSSGLERAADRAATAVESSGGPVEVVGTAARGLARQASSVYEGTPETAMSEAELLREIDMTRAWLRSNSIMHTDYPRMQATLQHLEHLLMNRDRRRASPAPPTEASEHARAERRRRRADAEREAQFGGLRDEDLSRELLTIRGVPRSAPVLAERADQLEAEMARRADEQRAGDARARALDDMEAEAERLMREMQDAQIRDMLEIRRRWPLLDLAEPVVHVEEFLIGMVPVLGELVGLYEAVTGRTLLTDEEISTGWRIAGGVLAVIPFAGRILRGGAGAARAVASLAVAAGRVGRRTPRQIVRLLTGIDTLAHERAFLHGAIEAARVGGRGPDQERALARILEAVGQRPPRHAPGRPGATPATGVEQGAAAVNAGGAPAAPQVNAVSPNAAATVPRTGGSVIGMITQGGPQSDFEILTELFDAFPQRRYGYLPGSVYQESWGFNPARLGGSAARPASVRASIFTPPDTARAIRGIARAAALPAARRIAAREGRSLVVVMSNHHFAVVLPDGRIFDVLARGAESGVLVNTLRRAGPGARPPIEVAMAYTSGTIRVRPRPVP
jgi:hypothetical protein